MRSFSLLVLSSAILAGTVSAKADAIPYASVGAIAPTNVFTATSTGNVTGSFIRGGALSGGGELFTDSIRLVDLTSGYTSPWLFNSQTTLAGASVNFGPVAANDVLIFDIQVQDLTNALTIFSSGPSRSADGVNHAYLTSFSGGVLNGVDLPAGLYAGFEDTDVRTNDNLGNLDYRDITAVFQNVTQTPSPAVTPEPASFVLLGTGALGAAGALRSRLSR